MEEVSRPHGATITVDVSEAEFDLFVVHREENAEGVVVLTLRQDNQRMLPPWKPGAHIDLLIPGIGPRQYSLSGDPAERHLWRIGVLREPEGRGGSEYVHESLQENSVIRARGPRNHFPLIPAEDYTFIAGGIGITPLLPMIREAAAAGARWRLIYLGRSRTTMAFRDELDAYSDRVTYWPREMNERFDLAGLLASSSPGTLIYACGPENLLEAIEACGETLPRGAVHTERFSAKPVTEPVLTESFDVELARSGITLTVPPDRSVLSVVMDHGIHVLWSCEEGTCGTCETGVLEGEVDHRDSVLTKEERQANDCMMVCVSRSCSKKLVLDL